MALIDEVMAVETERAEFEHAYLNTFGRDSVTRCFACGYTVRIVEADFSPAEPDVGILKDTQTLHLECGHILVESA